MNKYIISSFFLAVFGAGCALEASDPISSSSQNVLEDLFIDPVSFDDNGSIFPFPNRPVISNQSDCVNDKYDFSSELLFRNTEHIAQVKFLSCGEKILCNKSDFGIDVQYAKVSVVRNFGISKISRKIEIIITAGCSLQMIGNQYLISLFRYNDQFFSSKFLKLANSSEEAETLSGICATSSLPTKVAEFQKQYSSFLKNRDGFLDEQKERSVSMYDEECIQNEDARELKKESNGEEKNEPIEERQIEDNSNE